jgi:hypothetical protein
MLCRITIVQMDAPVSVDGIAAPTASTASFIDRHRPVFMLRATKEIPWEETSCRSSAD